MSQSPKQLLKQGTDLTAGRPEQCPHCLVGRAALTQASQGQSGLTCSGRSECPPFGCQAREQHPRGAASEYLPHRITSGSSRKVLPQSSHLGWAMRHQSLLSSQARGHTQTPHPQLVPLHFLNKLRLSMKVWCEERKRHRREEKVEEMFPRTVPLGKVTRSFNRQECVVLIKVLIQK